MTQPDVTVVVPTHDRRLFLAQTLASVLWQRDVDLEVVVVDDASASDPAEVVDLFRDRRIRLIHQETARGVAVARDAGASVARARWLAFVDDDDVWAPNKLSKQLRATASTGCSWCYTGAVRVDAGLHVLNEYRALPPREMANELRRWNHVPGGGSGVLLDRSVIPDDEPIFDPSLKHFADWELWIRLASRGLPAAVDEPLVGYRKHDGNKALETEGMLEDLRLIEERHGIDPDWGGINLYLAWLHQRIGRRRRAMAHFARAAVQGQVRAVVEGLGTLAGSRMRRAMRRQPQGPGPPIRDVDGWLVPLRERRDLLALTKGIP